ncbi:MFS transporter [Paraburkholderia phenoliruptrix]|uniref:MFS transporter n=1 Tax=Paraburkholderia phenoliruptrix TaxID=252970 RepID=UPI002869B889|nr:MFS transporter [Paraburkholderia phenoliruptrix]WMY11795.1 MFS transporter [Paraburkholderia phenoliruptrix]
MSPAHALPSGEGAVSKADRDPERLYRRVTWRLLPLLIVCYTFAYLDRVNVGFAKLQMVADLKFSDTVYGLGAGIFFIGYVLAEVPSNLVLHKLGARRWIARILVTWGILSAAMLVVNSPTSFYVLRFLLGVAEAGFFPGIIYYLMHWYPASRRGTVLATFYLAAPLSGLLGGPVSGYIMTAMAHTPPFTAWQWMFLIEGIPAVLLGIVVFFTLDDRIDDAKWLSADEKLRLNAELASEQHQAASSTVGSAFRDPRTWHLSAILFAIVMAMYGVFFWMPTLVNESGIKSPLLVGLLSAIPYAVAIPTMILIGRHSDRRAERRFHMIGLCFTGTAGFLLCVLWQHQTWPLLFALTLATAAVMATLPLFWTLPTAIFRGAAAAAGIALINSLGVTAGFVAPYMVGFLRDLTKSPNSGLYVLASLWVIAAVLIYKVPAQMRTQMANVEELNK